MSSGLVHVIDDDEAMRQSLQFLLDTAGFQARTYESAVQFLEGIETLEPGCIVTDVRMPEMNGLDATRAIRQLEAVNGGHTPIIGITAHALKGDREDCLAAGMDDYLSKPISPNKLAEKIDAWLGEEQEALTA